MFAGRNQLLPCPPGTRPAVIQAVRTAAACTDLEHPARQALQTPGSRVILPKHVKVSYVRSGQVEPEYIAERTVAIRLQHQRSCFRVKDGRPTPLKLNTSQIPPLHMDYGRQDHETAEDHAARLLSILRERDAQAAHDAEREAGDCAGAEEADMRERGTVPPAHGNGYGGGLEEVEAILVAESAKKQNPMVLELLKGLQKCAVYTDTPNHETNRKLWDAYAQSWSSDVGWLQRMSGHVARQADDLQFVGDEWSDKESLDAILDEWLYPHVLEKRFAVAEVGSGGGRIASRVAPKVERLVCFDVSEGMLARARSRVVGELGHQHVEFQLIDGDAPYPKEYNCSFDFVYSFDVFVHMDLHQMRQSLQCIRSILRMGGLCFLSFANLLAPDGWRRFAKQQHYSVGGFYFVSPDIVRCLLSRTGFNLVRMSKPQTGNTYLNRDLLIIAQKAMSA